MTYIRKEIYSIEEVLSKAVSGKTLAESIEDFDGDSIKMNSHRYQVFKLKGVKCVACGIEGSFFAKERTPFTPRYHFNLYAVVDDKEIMMTKDHIIPKSSGGKDQISNYQPMCSPCNQQKGNKTIPNY